MAQILPDNMVQVSCTSGAMSQPWDAHLIHSVNDIHTYFTPMVGDIDGDGVVEIVVGIPTTNNHYTTKIGVFRGTDLSEKSDFIVNASIYAGWAGTMLLVRYPNGDDLEIGAIVLHCFDHKLRSYDAQGNLLHVSNVNTPCDGAISTADFNGDGYPEIYIGNAVYDAATLKRLCDGGSTGSMGLGYRGSNTDHGHIAMSFAANLLGDEKPELICGNTIYSVDINSRTDAQQNSVNVVKTITPPENFPTQGHSLVADFNMDGQLDVLVVVDDSPSNYDGKTFFYAYDPVTENILFEYEDYDRATGYPLVGDIDGDGFLEIVFINEQENVSMARIRALKYTPDAGLSTMWEVSHTDNSGQTSMSLFDFNQDGIMEIVYRDENHLRIINGSGSSHLTGNDTVPCYDLYTMAMTAGTWNEYPVVADVNNDGAAEIVVAGKTGTGLGWVGGQLVIIAGMHPWAPARKVWNQYMYNVTNVNEDLSVPTQLFDNATAFTDPMGQIRRPFNNFLQQATLLDQYGRAFRHIPNVVVTQDSSTYFAGNNLNIEVTFCNEGEMILEAPFPIAVYAGQGNLVDVFWVNEPLEVGACQTVTVVLNSNILNELTSSTDLRIIVNDNGNGTSQYAGLQAECDTSDNVYVLQSSPCSIEMSNVITPNADGFNDSFVPQLQGDFHSIEMSIFDRWGKLVYKTASAEPCWTADGAPDGVYFCSITYRCRMSPKVRNNRNTSVTVIR